jgi:hypothetical protein
MKTRNSASGLACGRKKQRIPRMGVNLGALATRRRAGETTFRFQKRRRSHDVAFKSDTCVAFAGQLGDAPPPEIQVAAGARPPKTD